jgi:hypothetical protein
MDVREYVVTMRHDKGAIRIKTAASSAEWAVKQVLAAERAPLRAATRVVRRPTCDYCDQPATRYVRDSGDGTPLCAAHARDHYGTAAEIKAATGVLGVSRFEEMSPSDWGAEL